MKGNDKLKAAIEYSKFGFSVIPCNEQKKPTIAEWKPYQHKRADEKQISEWWDKWPSANVAIVTGAISGVIVIDVDTDEGWQALQEYLPETLTTPTCTTPRGGRHLYFKYRPGLRSGPASIPGVDIKTDGGYVIAPPSFCRYMKRGKRIEGGYSWLAGLAWEGAS